MPVGAVEPLAGVTMAVSVYDAPVVRVPPLGVTDNAVVVATAGGTTTVRAKGVVTV